MMNCIKWAKIKKTTTMFDNNRSTNGDERTLWTFKRAFYNGNNTEGRYWMLDISGQLCIRTCMSKNKRISNSKPCKAGHKYSKGTIYEMGT